MTFNFTTTNDKKISIEMNDGMFEIKYADGRYIGFYMPKSKWKMSNALESCDYIDRKSRNEIVAFCQRVWAQKAFT